MSVRNVCIIKTFHIISFFMHTEKNRNLIIFFRRLCSSCDCKGRFRPLQTSTNRNDLYNNSSKSAATRDNFGSDLKTKSSFEQLSGGLKVRNLAIVQKHVLEKKTIFTLGIFPPGFGSMCISL